MGYAEISPIRRPPASPEVEADGGQVAGRLLVFCMALLYEALSADRG